MSITFYVVVECEKCDAEFTVCTGGKPVSGVNARLAAFAAGWVTRTGNRGRDLCGACQ